MDLQYLTYFYAVAKHGGFSKASRELKVQQPSISRAVKLLEEQLNVTLFERKQRTVVLTKAGQAIFDFTRAIFEQVENIEQFAQGEKKDPRGDLTIGTSDEIASYVLAPVIKEFMGRFPHVSPRVYIGTSQDACQKMMSGELEFSVLFTIPPESGLKTRVLREIPSRVYIASEQEKNIKVRSSFIGSRELNYTANKSFPTLKMLKKNLPETETRVSSNSIETHKRLTLAGVGVSILPEFMTTEEVRSGQLRMIHPDYHFMAKLRIVRKASHTLSLAAQEFLKILENHLKIY